MSQKCSKCCWVCKSNRKGKIFQCQCCGHTDDADFNAADNHSMGQVFDLRGYFRFIKENKLSRNGFYWNANGITDRDGNDLVATIGCLEFPIPMK